MTRLTLAAAVCLSLSACGSGGVKVNGSNKTATMDCGGGGAAVSGSQNVLNLTGACASLSLSGANNRIIVALAKGASVDVSGTGNTATWKTDDGSEPKVRASGADNTVQKGL